MGKKMVDVKKKRSTWKKKVNDVRCSSTDVVSVESVEVLPEVPKSIKSGLYNAITNDDVKLFLECYRSWLDGGFGVTLKSFARSFGIRDIYRLLAYLRMNFTGDGGTIDFVDYWDRLEREREDKIVEEGVYGQVNANFLLGYMKAKYGWSENVTVVGIDAKDILEAKRIAMGGKDGGS